MKKSITKKIFALMFALIMVVSTIGCGSSDDNEEKGTKAESEAPKKDEDMQVVVDMPEGFVENEGMYFAPDYPNDSSNININEVDGDIGTDVTEEMFVSSIEETFKQVYNLEVDIEVKEFERTKIDGYNALRIALSYELAGSQIEQLQYVIQIGKKSTTVTYTQTNESNWTEQFEESAASIKVVPKTK